MKKYMLLALSGLFLMLQSCAPKPVTHGYFSANRYVSDYYQHIYNDSLKLHFRSPADIDFYTEVNVLENRIMEDEWLQGLPVLMYGKTSTPPYEVFVFASPSPLEIPADEYYRYDTLLNSMYLSIVGVPIDPQAAHAARADTQSMFESLETGDKYNREISSLSRVVNKYMHSNRYLEALNAIQNYPDVDEESFSLKYQMVLTFSSFLGENEVYASFIDDFEATQRPDEHILSLAEQHGLRDQYAFELLLQKTKDQKLVMVNENHFYPNHRIFLLDLLPALREQGYSYLALEALVPGEDSVLNSANTIPLLSTGFYLREQQYNWMIREAKRLGFRFVAYESEDGDREANQANNLYDATFGTDPDARVVVYAGLDHIYETSGPERMPRMAEIFKASYHIDPLTISQTRFAGDLLQGDYEYLLVRSAELPATYQMVDYHLLNRHIHIPQYPHANKFFRNTFDMTIQVSHFDGKEIDNYDQIGEHIPYFSTMLAEGEETQVPVITGQTTLQVIYDGFGNELKVRAIPAPEE